MRNKFTDKLKERVTKLFEAGAEKDHDPNSFWADPKKRKGLIIGIGAVFVIFAAGFMPETSDRLPRSQRNYSYDFGIHDLTEGEKNARPAQIFSDRGADKLDIQSSQQLLSAMEDEMRVKESELERERKNLNEREELMNQELDKLHMSNREELRSLRQETEKSLIDQEIEHKETTREIINALLNGEDPGAIDPAFKLNDEQKAAFAATQGYMGSRTDPNTFADVAVIDPTGQNRGQHQQTIQGTRRNVVRPGIGGQGGIRVLNDSGNYRVSTGQTLDMNNHNSVSTLAKQQQGSNTLAVPRDVFAELEEARSQLREKRQLEWRAQEQEETVRREEKERAENTVPLTAGSILSGTLMNGMYVPTGSSANNEPIPGIFRIKREALMPNYNVSAEVVECVIVAAAKPAIESIRVNFRASAITCIREDGTATEDKIMAVSSGPDGTTGVPATLISRNSDMLMKTATAGFLEGLTDIFSQTSLEINSDDGVYAISGSDLARLTGSAALGGAGDAMQRLADYFMDIADKMQPTLKVSAGIEVDFLVTSLSVLDFNKESVKVR